MRQRKLPGRHLFVLDTNVLMHDPAAIFRFQEHDIFVPMVVLEELDAAKKGSSEVARNARHASRLLDSLIGEAGQDSIHAGLPLLSGGGNGNPGRVFFQTQAVGDNLPASLPGGSPDNSILSTAIALQEQHPDSGTVVVSKDINLRIKARILGIRAEDYLDDMVLDDASLLYNGMSELPPSASDLVANKSDRLATRLVEIASMEISCRFTKGSLQASLFIAKFNRSEGCNSHRACGGIVKYKSGRAVEEHESHDRAIERYATPDRRPGKGLFPSPVHGSAKPRDQERESPKSRNRNQLHEWKIAVLRVSQRAPTAHRVVGQCHEFPSSEHQWGNECCYDAREPRSDQTVGPIRNIGPKDPHAKHRKTHWNR